MIKITLQESFFKAFAISTIYLSLSFKLTFSVSKMIYGKNHIAGTIFKVFAGSTICLSPHVKEKDQGFSVVTILSNLSCT